MTVERMAKPPRLLATRQTANGGPSVPKVRALDEFFGYGTMILNLCRVLVVDDEGDIGGSHGQDPSPFTPIILERAKNRVTSM